MIENKSFIIRKPLKWGAIILNLDKFKRIEITVKEVTDPNDDYFDENEPDIMWGVYLAEEGRDPITLAAYYDVDIAKGAAYDITMKLARGSSAYDLPDIDRENSYRGQEIRRRREEQKRKEEEREKAEFARRVKEITENKTGAA